MMKLASLFVTVATSLFLASARAEETPATIAVISGPAMPLVNLLLLPETQSCLQRIGFEGASARLRPVQAHVAEKGGIGEYRILFDRMQPAGPADKTLVRKDQIEIVLHTAPSVSSDPDSLLDVDCRYGLIIEERNDSVPATGRR